MAKIKASVLAFDRRLSSSNGIFYGVTWAQKEKTMGRPLPVQEKSVRGVIDHRLKGNQATQTKVESSIENANLQTVDYCTLGFEEDTLRVIFNLQLAGKIEPCACNNQQLAENVAKMVEDFRKREGFNDLCRRYVFNLANGRFLWRNRLGSDEIKIKVALDTDEYVFDALSISTKRFDVDNEFGNKINEIASKMAGIFSKDESHVNLKIDACARKIPGIEVYPSQELVTDNSTGKGKKSKYLFEAEAAGTKSAAFHPQKITNAIHTIDNWYSPDADFPISINSYGAVTPQGRAYRNPGENDFYTLFDKAVNKGFSDLKNDDQNYVMAMLIRGGVFGEGD